MRNVLAGDMPQSRWEGRWVEDRVVHMDIRGDLQPHGKRLPDRLEIIKIQFSFTLGRGGDLAGKVFAR